MDQNESKKVYNYQKRFTYLEAPLYSLIIVLFIASWLPAIVGLSFYGQLYSSTIRFGIFLDFSILIMSGIIFLVRSELKKTMFLISEDVIVLKAPGKLRQIFFSDIVLCKHVQTLFSEHIRITSSDKTIELPFSINGIYDLVLTINERIITANKSAVLEEITPGSMISAARLRKFGYYREKNAFYPLIFSTILLTVLNVLIAYKVWELEMVPIFMWSIIGFIIPINVFTFGEYIISSQIKKHEKESGTEYPGQFFMTSYIFSGLVFLMLYLCAGIAFKTMF
jgi:hypothetical protein